MFESEQDREYQDGVNESEWQDPANWWAGLLYYSPRDDRVFVPKQVPSFGATINLGRPVGLAIVLAIPVLLIGLVVAAVLRRMH